MIDQEKFELVMGKSNSDYHQDLVDKTWKTTGSCGGDLLKAVMGTACESVELLNKLNRSMYKGKDLVREDLLSEIGDIWYYLRKVMLLMGVTVNEVTGMNRDKLADGKHGWPEKKV